MNKNLQEILSPYFNLDIMGDVIEKVIFSIKGRSAKYGEFGLSRHEYEKFGISERKLRFIIERLRDTGIIKLERVEYTLKDGKPSKYNIYSLGNILRLLFQTLRQGVDNLNEKIVTWCKNQRPIDVMRSFGISVTSSGRIGDKESKITVNKRTGAITNWKEGKKYNLFNYLRELQGQGILEFYNNFVGS